MFTFPQKIIEKEKTKEKEKGREIPKDSTKKGYIFDENDILY